MSAYLDKSKKNLSASELLLNKTLPDASIHCSYYAVVQQMLHVLFIKLKISQQQFDADKRNNNDGTHGYAGKLIGIDLIKRNRADYKWFQREMPALKKQREIADYQDKNMTPDEAVSALSKSNALINLLKENFK
ncbi:MAG: hypothetical protein ABIX01_11135 [Chitinophagaceae bacterium]